MKLHRQGTPSLPVARRVSSALLLAGFSTLAILGPGHAHAADAWHFSFGAARDGYTTVDAGMAYDAKRGFGFEPGAEVRTAGYLVATKPSYFTADVPEGNYNVTVKLGAAGTASNTTIKSELRRLMLENVSTASGATETRTFTVNVRTPRIKAVAGVAAGVVDLKVPRETVSEARAWDQRLTLEINGSNPVIQSIDIVPVTAPTIFLLGDSTVSDQPGEPFNSWGQMLPRFFKPGIAVANLAQSGETYRDSLSRRRLDKVLSMMRPGDTVLMQFGHNDGGELADTLRARGTIKGIGNESKDIYNPIRKVNETVYTYGHYMRKYANEAKSKGAIPIIVSPVPRNKFDDKNKISKDQYGVWAQEVSKQTGAYFLDLNTMVIEKYEKLGSEKVKAFFPKDHTHTNESGAVFNAELVAQGIKDLKKSELRKYLK